MKLKLSLLLFEIIFIQCIFAFDDKIMCFEDNLAFKICKNSSHLISVDKKLGFSSNLELTSDENLIINKEAFKNLSIQTLILNGKFLFKKESFNNLRLDNLILSNVVTNQTLIDVLSIPIKLEYLQQIVIFNSTIKSIGVDPECQYTSGATVLSLKYTKIGFFENNAFSCFGGLEVLSLICNGLTDINSPQLFKSLKNLKALKIPENNITSILNNTFNGLNELVNIDLNFNKLKKIEAGTFDNLPLEKISISNNEIISLPNNIFKTLKLLKKLNLSSNKFLTINNELFSGLINLEELNLNYNKINNIDYNAFLGTNINTLELIGNQLTNLNGECFNGIENSLRYIYLNDNKISTIKQNVFSNLKMLRGLVLFRNLITKIEDDAFSGLNITRVLMLGKNNLTTIDVGTFRGLVVTDLVLSNNEKIYIKNDAFNNTKIVNLWINSQFKNAIINVDKNAWGLSYSTSVLFKEFHFDNSDTLGYPLFYDYSFID